MRGKRQWVGAGVVALLPWTWFAVRNLTLVLDLVATVSWLLAGTVAVVGPWRPQSVPPPVRGFRVVSANVNSKNPTIDRAVADALAQNGDLVLLIEAGKGKWTPP